MDDETFEADATAPVLDLTADQATAEPEAPETNAEPVKTFTQEELDAIVGKRLAREQRKWEREARAPEAPKGEIYSDDFDSTEAYVEALAERKAEELLAKREQTRAQQTALDAYHDREEQAREKYDDFEQVAYNPSLKVTNEMAQVIQASDIGPDLIYHLGSNPKEAERISRLAPFLQAKELGRIEATLVTTPPARKTTTAPAPLSPVTARTSGAPVYDTTDPRSLKTMSTSEWIAAERARQLKRAGG